MQARSVEEYFRFDPGREDDLRPILGLALQKNYISLDRPALTAMITAIEAGLADGQLTAR